MRYEQYGKMEDPEDNENESKNKADFIQADLEDSKSTDR